MRTSLIRLFAASFGWAFACGATWLSAADKPEVIFAEAVAAWHMATAADAAGAKSELKARGVVRWGVPLADDDSLQDLVFPPAARPG